MREDDIKKSLGGGYQPHFFLVDKIVLAKIPPRAVWGSFWNACFLKKLPPPPSSSPFFEKWNLHGAHLLRRKYVALTGFDTHAAGIEPLLHTYLTNLQIWSGIQNVILSEKSSLWSKIGRNCDFKNWGKSLFNINSFYKVNKYNVKILAKNPGDIVPVQGLVHQI